MIGGDILLERLDRLLMRRSQFAEAHTGDVSRASKEQ